MWVFYLFDRFFKKLFRFYFFRFFARFVGWVCSLVLSVFLVSICLVGRFLLYDVVAALILPWWGNVPAELSLNFTSPSLPKFPAFMLKQFRPWAKMSGLVPQQCWAWCQNNPLRWPQQLFSEWIFSVVQAGYYVYQTIWGIDSASLFVLHSFRLSVRWGTPIWAHVREYF